MKGSTSAVTIRPISGRASGLFKAEAEPCVEAQAGRAIREYHAEHAARHGLEIRDCPDCRTRQCPKCAGEPDRPEPTKQEEEQIFFLWNKYGECLNSAWMAELSGDLRSASILRQRAAWLAEIASDYADRKLGRPL